MLYVNDTRYPSPTKVNHHGPRPILSAADSNYTNLLRQTDRRTDRQTEGSYCNSHGSQRSLWDISTWTQCMIADAYRTSVFCTDPVVADFLAAVSSRRPFPPSVSLAWVCCLAVQSVLVFQWRDCPSFLAAVPRRHYSNRTTTASQSHTLAAIRHTLSRGYMWNEIILK